MTRMLAGVISLALAGSAAGQTLDYDQCVAMALENHPLMQASRARIDQAKAAASQATRSRLPSLEAKLIATHTDQPLNAFGIKLSQERATFADLGLLEYTGPGSANTPPSALNDPDAVTNFNTRIEMRIPIYNGGMISAMRDQALSMQHAAEQGDAAVRQMLAFYILQAYEGVHTARAYADVALQAEKAAQSLVDTTNNLIRQGVVVRSEGLTAEVNLSSVKVDVARARNQVALAQDQLRMLVGQQGDDSMDVAQPVTIVTPERTVDEWLDIAFAANPKLQAEQAMVEAAGAEVEVAASSLKPHLNMMARNDWNDEEIDGFAASGYTIGAELSWNLLDFGATRRGVDRQEAARIEKMANLEQSRQQLELEIRKAWRLVHEADERVVMRELAVKQATEAQSLIDQRYANGLATLTEVLGTRAQLDKSRADLVLARYEQKIQRASLLLASGQLDTDSID